MPICIITAAYVTNIYAKCLALGLREIEGNEALF